jgi:primase-polymerase (primpol)-like protein
VTTKPKNNAALHRLPAELRALPRWVCWVEVTTSEPGRKPDKKPINPRTGAGASSTNPNDWATFDEALAALEQGDYAGLMFAMVPDDGFVFIDLDDCRNPTNKGIHKWAEGILKELNSYSEVSPSGKGVHVFVRAKKPGERCRHGNVEIYDHARFAVMTGRRLERYSERIESRQAELEAVYQKHVAVSQNALRHAVPCRAR